MSLPTLSKELLISIFSFLNLSETNNTLSTCKSLHQKSHDPAFLAILMSQLNLCDITHFLPSIPNIPSFFHNIYKNLIFSLQKPHQEISWIPLDASSTDKDQTIYNTLPEGKGFWSTAGCEDENSVHWLLFDLGEDFDSVILKEINIKFQFFYYLYMDTQYNSAFIYPSKYVQVEMGFHPNQPIWASDMLEIGPVQAEDPEINIKVEIFPKVIFARYVKVKFIGMKSRFSIKDNLFYVCVDEVIPELVPCKNIDSHILHEILENTYNNSMEPKYIRDIAEYNKGIVEELADKENDKEAFERILNENSQLKADIGLFSLLIKEGELTDMYLERLSNKQLYLNLLETVLVLNLSLNWDKHNPYDNSEFLKNDKYFTMFWLFYFERRRMREYFYNVFDKGHDKAFGLLQAETPEDVKNVELHSPLEFKKVILLSLLQRHLDDSKKKNAAPLVEDHE